MVYKPPVKPLDTGEYKHTVPVIKGPYKRHKRRQRVGCCLICMGIAILVACPWLAYLVIRFCEDTKWFTPAIIIGPLLIDAVALNFISWGDKFGD